MIIIELEIAGRCTKNGNRFGGEAVILVAVIFGLNFTKLNFSPVEKIQPKGVTPEQRDQ